MSVPADIIQAAKHAVELQSVWLRDEPHKTAEHMLCAAMIAERERCARIFDYLARCQREIGNGARANQYEHYASLIRKVERSPP